MLTRPYLSPCPITVETTYPKAPCILAEILFCLLHNGQPELGGQFPPSNLCRYLQRTIDSSSFPSCILPLPKEAQAFNLSTVLLYSQLQAMSDPHFGSPARPTTILHRQDFHASHMHTDHLPSNPAKREVPSARSVCRLGLFSAVQKRGKPEQPRKELFCKHKHQTVMDRSPLSHLLMLMISRQGIA